jgi:hypothetical protein
MPADRTGHTSRWLASAASTSDRVGGSAPGREQVIAATSAGAADQVGQAQPVEAGPR